MAVVPGVGGGGEYDVAAVVADVADEPICVELSERMMMMAVLVDERVSGDERADDDDQCR